MIREVDLVSYLPPFLAQYKEINAALEAENPEFMSVWKMADRVLRNEFILTADEYGISKFEKLLGIYPMAEDTLEGRRSRVCSKWFTVLPYSMRMLVRKLEMLCVEHGFEYTENFKEGYSLTIKTHLELCGQVEELERVVQQMVPVHMDVIIRNSIHCNAQATAYTGGGVIYMQTFVVSNDFYETCTIDAKAASGGGVVHTEERTIMDSTFINTNSRK